jgi:Putative peptidoglycan binding domain
MSTDKQGIIHGASEGGIVGEHPDPASFKFLVGPSTGSELNTLRVPLVPIFCWKVEDIRFAFDSSFVTFNPDPLTNPDDPTSDPIAQPFDQKNDIRKELKALADLVNANPGCPLSVFGHADPVGPAVNPDGYNKALSGRRAAAIYALLISGTQPGQAATLWQQIASQESWGSNQIQVMQASGLSGNSIGGLIPGYLQKLCPKELNLKLQPTTDFLARGTGSGGKGDYQGCSSFNPLIIFSQQQEDSFAPGANDQNKTVYDERNLANAPNRRVMVLAFPKGSKVDPNKWPCPSAQGMQTYSDYSACVKRFWSNGQARRSTRLPDDDRTYARTKDTFACRFYDRLMSTSPCEKVFWVVRLLYDGTEPINKRPALANLPYSVIGVDGTSKKFQGTTDGNGILRIPVISDPATMTLSIAGLQITLNGGSLKKIKSSDIDTAVGQRLGNLGFYDDPTDASASKALVDALTLFQENNDLPLTDGTVDSQTRRSLRSSYGS